MKKFASFCLLSLISFSAMSMGFPHSVAAAKRGVTSSKTRPGNLQKMNLQKTLDEAKPASVIQKAVNFGQKLVMFKFANK